MDPKMVQDLLSTLKEAYALGGWLAVIPIALVAAVNIYKLPFFQGFLPEKFRWDRLRGRYQLLIVFLVALLGGLGTSLMAGVSFAAALVTAFGAAITAAIGHTFMLKPAAKALTPAAAALPDTVSRPLSLIVPFKREELEAARAARAASK